MRIRKRLAVGLFAVAMTLSSCSFDLLAQQGYDKIKSDIKSGLRVPSSYKAEKAECYYDPDMLLYSYQYRIAYTAQTAAGITLKATCYYGYNAGNETVRNYGSDPSYFNRVSLSGKRQSIIA